MYRPRRISLRRSDARDGRQRGSARGQMQKISAGKFHFELPSPFTSLDHLVGAGEKPGGNSVDLSATGHCRLAHANELQMSGHARFPRIRVLWMVGAVVNDNVLEIEGA